MSIAGSWVYITLNNPVLVTNTTNYCWVLSTSSLGGYSLTNSFNVAYDTSNGADTISTDNGSTWASIAYSFGPSGQIGFKNYGASVPVADISTGGATYNNGVYTLNGYVSSLGVDPAVSVDFNFGPDTNYGQTASNSSLPVGFNNTITSLTTPGAFSCSINAANIPSSWTDLHYQASMTGTTSGTVTVGADKSIPVAAVIPTNTGGNNGNSSGVIMSTNKAANITVNSAQVTGTINSDGIETYDGITSGFVTVEICWGTDATLSEAPIILANNTGFLGTFTPVELSNLSPDTQYSFQLEALGTLQTMPYVGGIQKFTTLGLGGSGTGSKPLIVTVGDAFFNKIGVGAGGWWILLAFLMAAIWLISAVRENPFVGVAVDAVLIGGFLVMGTLNIWLFIILAVLAGAILVGVIIKPGRAGD